MCASSVAIITSFHGFQDNFMSVTLHCMFTEKAEELLTGYQIDRTFLLLQIVEGMEHLDVMYKVLHNDF